MQTSIFLARLLGPTLLLAGVALLLNPRTFRALATEVLGSVTLVFMFGFLDFVAGLAIVLTHNVWVASWRVLITLLGWLLLIRGAARALGTEKVMSYGAKVMRNKQVFVVSGVVLVVLGLVLCYFGYAARA